MVALHNLKPSYSPIYIMKAYSSVNVFRVNYIKLLYVIAYMYLHGKLILNDSFCVLFYKCASTCVHGKLLGVLCRVTIWGRVKFGLALLS